MSLAEDLRGQIGHNMPPTTAEILAEEHAELLAQIDVVTAKAETLPKKIGDDLALGRLGDVSREASKLKSKIDDVRKAAVEPHLTAQRETNGFFNASIDRLKRLVDALGDRATDYQRVKAAEERRVREEEARKLREEQDRQREIAEAAAQRNRPNTAMKHEDRAIEAGEAADRAEAAARASAADLTRVRSSTGTVATTRTTWDFEVVDAAVIPLDALRPYIPRADLEKAIRSYVRVGGRDLAGVRIFENAKASFR